MLSYYFVWLYIPVFVSGEHAYIDSDPERDGYQITQKY